MPFGKERACDYFHLQALILKKAVRFDCCFKKRVTDKSAARRNNNAPPSNPVRRAIRFRFGKNITRVMNGRGELDARVERLLKARKRGVGVNQYGVEVSV